MQTPPGHDLPRHEMSTQRLLEQTCADAHAGLPGQAGGRHLPLKQVSVAAHGVDGQVKGSVQSPPSPHTWVPMQSAVLLHLI